MIEMTENSQHDQSFVSSVSSAVRAIEDAIAEIASTNIPVLLVGESGTGKQIFAHRIHQLSHRREQPLIKVACASMTGESFASELGLKPNGHAATHSDGTIFFDEIGELDAPCQRALLCALPDGDATSHSGLLTARVISTTNRNLDDEVRAGRFRSELYYRINGVSLRLPPLRERKEDIPKFVEFFTAKHSARLGRPRPVLNARLMSEFMSHPWPGNIRELENVVIRMVALGDDQFVVSHVPAEIATPAPAIIGSPTHSLKDAARAASREAERELIVKTLARTHWNRKRAAQELQISYKALLYKLKQISLDDKDLA